MTVLQRYQDLFDGKIAFRFGKAELFELIEEIKQWTALNGKLVDENKKLHDRILHLEVIEDTLRFDCKILKDRTIYLERQDALARQTY